MSENKQRLTVPSDTATTNFHLLTRRNHMKTQENLPLFRGELALLLWQNAGRPEPAALPVPGPICSRPL